MKSIIRLTKPVYIISSASVAGDNERNGPLGDLFDITDGDGTDKFGKQTWEESEGEMQRLALTAAIQKGGIEERELSAVFAGDLQNQCVGSNYGLLGFDVPFFGLYGACSTCAEGLILASILSSGYDVMTASVASSHNCAAERQFRYPIEYGGQRAPTAQWTVTGAGAFVLSPEKKEGAPYITEVLPGRSIDRGINDLNNMGAAMAPAAIDTLKRYFDESGRSPDSFDMIVTGDLGAEGSRIFREFMSANGYEVGCNHVDCGLMIYDRKEDDRHAGGSGCGCSASVLSAHILPRMTGNTEKNGDEECGEGLYDILFMATGALMSPASVQQGNNIPGICHLVHIEAERKTDKESSLCDNEDGVCEIKFYGKTD